MATEIGSLLIDMRADVARLAQDMAKAQSTVEGAMDKVKVAAGRAATALGLVGAGVAVAGLANVVKGAVGAMAALDDMAARAGTTVENMSALADVARIGGHDIGIAETAMVRLSKALAGGDEEAKGAGRALATLGLKAEDLRKMDTAEALLKVAQALDQYGSGAGKTALALDLLGKSGAAAIPYLEDLAEKGTLAGTVTAEQAAAAERLEKDINAVKLAGEQAQRAMVATLLPAMGDIAKAMRLAAEEGGTFKAMLVGFGGLATEFVNPLKASFMGLDAALHESLATFNEWAAKFTFGDVKQNLLRQAIREREIAQKLYADIASLGRSAAPGGGPDKPKLPYTSGASGTGKSSRGIEDEEDVIYKIREAVRLKNKKGFDEDEQARKREEESIEKLRQKYIGMADPLQKYRVELDQINQLREAGLLTTDQAIEAEWAVGEAMDKAREKMEEFKDTGKDAFADLSKAIESWGNKAADTFADFVVDGNVGYTIVTYGLQSLLAERLSRENM